MFFFDSHNIKIFSRIREKSLDPEIGSPYAFPSLLDGPSIILGHCERVRACVWSSGAAHVVPGGRRRRLLELKITDFRRFPSIFIDFH